VLNSASNEDPLDRIAEAVRHRGKFAFRSSFQIDELLAPLTPARWKEFAKSLGCKLPSLVDDEGGVRNVDGRCADVWNLQTYLWKRGVVAAPHLARWPTPLLDWQESQIFVEVRVALMDAAGVDAWEVTRRSRLIPDLGME
jgi:hypothetical protein